MRVEGGDLVDLGLGQAHLFGQRAQVRGGKVAVRVLNEVQKLDQQVAVARAVAQERLHPGQRVIIQLAALRVVAALAPARFPNALVVIKCHVPHAFVLNLPRILVASPENGTPNATHGGAVSHI